MASTAETIVSDLANDPDMLDLVEEFVAELPTRAAAVQTALEAQDMDTVRRLAHQLKGAAGGYGFQPISTVAGMLEQSVSEEARLTDIARQVQELADICARARAR